MENYAWLSEGHYLTSAHLSHDLTLFKIWIVLHCVALQPRMIATSPKNMLPIKIHVLRESTLPHDYSMLKASQLRVPTRGNQS